MHQRLGAFRMSFEAKWTNCLVVQQFHRSRVLAEISVEINADNCSRDRFMVAHLTVISGRDLVAAEDEGLFQSLLEGPQKLEIINIRSDLL